jgi:hypothetical protein
MGVAMGYDSCSPFLNFTDDHFNRGSYTVVAKDMLSRRIIPSGVRHEKPASVLGGSNHTSAIKV